MIYLYIIILSIIQGITEFLPISSSGHLVLTHHFLNDKEFLTALNQKRLDIAVHVGTLLAVILYFRNDFIDLIRGGINILQFKFQTENSHKALLVLTSSIPILICGFVIYQMDVTLFDSIEIIAWTTLIFGILLYIADKKPETDTQIDQFTWKTALIYGLAQCIALIPGVSRSGITITAGRFLGHSRVEAARFSMFMGMVTITAAGVLTSLSVFQDANITNDFMIIMALGMIVSFIIAYISILVMMRWIAQCSFTPFVIYRVILGCVLLFLVYSGHI